MSAPEIDYKQILESPCMTVGWLRSMLDTLIRDAGKVIQAADAGEIENIYPVRDLRWTGGKLYDDAERMIDAEIERCDAVERVELRVRLGV